MQGLPAWFESRPGLRLHLFLLFFSAETAFCLQVYEQPNLRASRLKNVLPREAPDCDLDASERDEGEEGFGEVLEILGEAAVAAEPGEGSFDQRLYNVARSRSFWSVMLVPMDLVMGPGI